MLLDAVEQARQNHPDLDDFVVIRLGHVTHATEVQARRMAELGVEADINLDSNIVTGSWPLNSAPGAVEFVPLLEQTAADPKRNFELNDLSGFLMPDPGDTAAVAAVFGTHPLRLLLMAGVRVMLSTDGSGVEHASMAREYGEYALADSLIQHWHATDPEFARQAAGASTQTLDDNVAWHLGNLQDNAAWDDH